MTKQYTIAEYEDGWFVEKPDPNAALEDCKFVQVNGPFNSEADAQVMCDAYNNAWVLPAAYKFADKLRS